MLGSRHTSNDVFLFTQLTQEKKSQKNAVELYNEDLNF